ncbi:MAG: deoxyhypusine synthase family protein [bacterium]
MVNSEKWARRAKDFSDGVKDDLEPLIPLDLDQVHSFNDLVCAMSKTAFGGRQLGEAADVLETMVRDVDCRVVGTFSGAMTVAKMGLVICKMISSGMLHAIVSTGALICHGVVETSGKCHFKYQPGMNDADLYRKGYDRIYDSIELEANLDHTEQILHEALYSYPDDTMLCSHRICRDVGDHLNKQGLHRGILSVAAAHDVPVFIPAFTDSEIGISYQLHNDQRTQEGRKPLRFDPFLDFQAYNRLLLKAARLGIFTIGGGVPRNWAQQMGPYVDSIQRQERGYCYDPIRFRYGVRICPEPAYWGGLSGCTYSEGISWGKFLPPEEGGQFGEVFCDATIAWPLLVKAVLERLGQ